MSSYKAKKRLDYKSPDFTATNIDLQFQLADDFTVVRSTAHYVRLSSDKKVPLRLDGEELELRDVLLNGQTCKYAVVENELIVPDVPDEFDLTTECVISPVQNTSLMGLYKSSGCFCTQCEPEGFRRITYFLDRPDVLAKYRVTIFAPEYGCGVLLSNGNLVESGVKNDRHYTVWEDPFPKPSYLFALVAGSFDIIEDKFITKSGREVKLALYVDRGACERGKWAMQCIKDSMAWDEERFNLEYDLDNFKVVAVDFFNFGAMENKSLNIFNSSCVLVDPDTATDMNYYTVQGVIGHEYFHNWTGDRVTLRDWFQLSLKESLTVFRDQEFSSDVFSRVLTRLKSIEVIRSSQFAEDASPMAHPVRPEQVMEMNNFYTVTIYDKGAEVIRMIHTILGEEAFQKALANYLTKFDGSAATIEDFVMTMENSSKIDLMQFRRWYTQAGTPEVHARWDYLPSETEGNCKLVLTLTQSTPPTPGQATKEPFVIPVRTSFLSASGETVVPEQLPQNGILMFTKDEQKFEFDVPEQTIPVVLRDFSAPVKLSTMHSVEDFRNILDHCDDPFIRIDAQMSLVKQYIHDHIDKAQSGMLPEPTDIINAIGYVLKDENIDLQLKALLIEIPALRALMETFKRINLDSLVLVRDHLEQSVARALESDYRALEQKTRPSGKYKFDKESAALRSVHNVCLKMITKALLQEGKDAAASEMVLNAYYGANNMTDRIAAMTIGVHEGLGCASQLLEAFEESYGNDPLTFDKFFNVQATVPHEDTVKVVRKLLEHPRFDITNPNRVRSLMGALGYGNPVALHRKDGLGYLLMYDVVKQLNKINPSIAARIIDGMIQYKRFDDSRIQKATEYLNKIKAIDGLSRSVFEKVNAALGEEQE